MIKVLYVDDEPSLLDICREFIEVPGQISMDTALSARDAEIAMVRVDYEVVVSDYQMPGMNGIEFLKRLRSRLGHIPFILFTGRGREEVAIEALNCGADFYLQKGGDPSVQYGQLKKAILQLAKNRETERSLIISQRRYADLVEEVNAVAMKQDPDMTITYVNPYGLKKLGWSNALVGTNFAEWLYKAREGHDGPRQTFLSMFAQRDKGETFTHPFRTMEGEKRWVAWTCRFIRNDRGTVEEVLLIGTDVTDTKWYEAELRRSLSLIKAAFDTGDEGVLVTTLDRNATEYNQRFLEMWRITAEVMGSGGHDLIPFVKDQLLRPDLLEEYINNVYSDRLSESKWTIDFTDGRKFLVHTKPVMLGTEVEGRFWNFTDVTLQTIKEKELDVREENILGLLDNNKANMMIIDPVSEEIVYANKAAVEFYGYDRERLLGMRITDINTMPPETVVREMRLAEAGKKNYFTFKHRVANGEVWDVEVFSGTIDFNGRTMLFSMVHDISAMEKTKILVEQTELRHNRILNNLAIGIIVTDPSGKIIYGNRTVLELLLRTPEELIGLNSFDIIADDQKEMARQNFTPRVKGVTGHVDYRLIRGDGTEIWALVTAVPVLLDNGAYGGTIASIMDISERRRDAEIVKENEKKFRDIFNNTNDAVMIHRPKGNFLEVNDVACKRYGFTREEMQQMRPENLETPETASAVPEKLRPIMKDDSAIFESIHLTKDGQKIPSEINAIVTEYKGAPAVLVVCRDITNRKIAEQNLAKANDKLKILNGITRHDVMNQLMVLKGNLDLVMSQFMDGPTLERLHKIDNSASMIEYQLHFARDYQDMGTVPPQFQNIGKVISQLPDVKEIAVMNMDPEMERLRVFADPMLGKVFHNIMEDSIKYADKPLRIKLSHELRDRNLVIIYEDVGPGISVEEKGKIFDMGFGKGTGLGLYLSREILAITGIKIRENGELGKGVRFEIEVPEGRYRFEKESG